MVAIPIIPAWRIEIKSRAIAYSLGKRIPASIQGVGTRNLRRVYGTTRHPVRWSSFEGLGIATFGQDFDQGVPWSLHCSWRYKINGHVERENLHRKPKFLPPGFLQVFTESNCWAMRHWSSPSTKNTDVNVQYLSTQYLPQTNPKIHC